MHITTLLALHDRNMYPTLGLHSKQETMLQQRQRALAVIHYAIQCHLRSDFGTSRIKAVAALHQGVPGL